MNHNFRNRLLILTAALVASQGGTYLILRALGLAEQAYSSLVVNGVFLLTCLGCIRLFKLTSEDVGLKIIPQRLAVHVKLSAALFILYWLYYLFGVRISGFRPFTSDTIFHLLNYLVVSFVEEIYFRGLWYHIVEARFSSRAAILISGLVFGLSHFKQGLGMLPLFFTGWLWGSIRYATGMIYLLIPLHFTYNTVWLLFQGRWGNLPELAYFFPLAELLTAILIIAGTKDAANHVKFKFDL